MKTTLTPPPITPNWRPSHDRVGLLKVERNEGRRTWFELQNWYVQDDEEHAANCRFFGATAAMAEALENCRQYLARLPESMHAESSGVYLGALSALLHAGYVAPTTEG